MTLTLALGVIDVPYVEGGAAIGQKKRIAQVRPGKQKPRKTSGGGQGAQSTGDVAEILERKYHIMETFFDLHEEQIGEMLAESMVGALESLTMGAPPSLNPYGAATSEIDAAFKEYLSTEEIAETGTPGVPTKAALRRVNQRLKLKRGPRRPSFIDTGLYQSSFVSWVEDK